MRVLSLNLPIWKFVDLSNLFWTANGTEIMSPRLLPKESLLYLHRHMMHARDFKVFRYVYYSECDQILHIRTPADVVNTIDFYNGEYAVLPHRLQVGF